ncbi:MULTISPECIES: ROK family protein [unclassified Lysinibacillus]|uniref:ROK family protein n=1 Tax=unclassified Lysinibacillus TaxID=2636778 RepID=UPI0038191CFB
MQQKEYLVGVDMGGTKIAVGLLSVDGKIIKETRMDTRGHEGPEIVVNRLVAAINAFSEGYEIKGIGVGVPGIVDSDNGIIHYWSTFNWNNVPLGQMLNAQLDKKITVVNDASAATWGEFNFGAGQQSKNMLFMTISTGIGGGIIFERQLFTGSNMLAGEIGHVTVNPNGPTCNCGKSGCLEAYASGVSIQRRAMDAIKYRPSILVEMEKHERRPIDTKMVFAAYESGDLVAQEIIEQAATYVGIVLANFIQTFNPDRIVLGGGVMKTNSQFIEKIEEVTQNYVLPSYRNTYEIRRSQLFENAALIGAANLIV